MCQIWFLFSGHTPSIETRMPCLIEKAENRASSYTGRLAGGSESRDYILLLYYVQKITQKCGLIAEMNIISGILLGAALWCRFGIAQTDKGDLATDALVKRLSFIFKDEKLNRTDVGIEVYSLNRQQSLFSINPEKPLSPASAIKVLTGVVALKKLGPDFTFKTRVYMDGTLQGGVLKGNLYLKGDGDPSLVSERMYMLATQVARSGFKTVQGQIVIDDWTFDQARIDASRIPSDTDRAYNAVVGGLSFNYNTTTAYFRPGKNKAEVFVEPDTGYIKVQNESKVSARGSGYKLVASRIAGKEGDTLLVRGSMPQGLSEQKSHFNITSPVLYAGFAFRYYLGLLGIQVVNKSIGHKEVPITAQQIAELESLPLREIVTLMNKFSNNFIADTLVKTLGRQMMGSPGTMDKGLQVIREEATKLGINSKGFRVVSGSGLTRENRMSSRQFIQLMNAAYLDFDVLPELLSSFPIAGKDGTLRSRMKGTSAFGRLRGKTGTIDGVVSLVGIVQSKGGELLAFSVLMNDKSQKPSAMRPWQNYFGQALADFNRQSPMSERPGPIMDTIGNGNEEVPEGPQNFGAR